MPSILAQFQAQNPGVVIDLILSERELNLSRRDADVAIRVTNDPPETLVGRRICAMRWGVYCRRDLADEIGPGAVDIAAVRRVRRRFRAAARRAAGSKPTSARSASPRGSIRSIPLLEMAVHGFGACPLPCFLGEPERRPGAARPDRCGSGTWAYGF